MTNTNIANRQRWISEVKRVDKPWGHEEIFALVDGKFCGKAIHVNAGHSLSLQYHQQKEEVMAVQSGEIDLEIGDHESQMESFRVGPGESFWNRPGTRHRITAVTDTILLEASTTELMDVVRLEDKYGREGTNAP